MLLRRKILLALIESCGGELSRTDMQKLLFSYCAERGINYYDFFPHKFGCFSFLSYQDKRVLTSQGYLKEGDSFKLKRRPSILKALEPDEQRHVREFVARTRGLRGKVLVRHVYLNYPYYAHRSEIKERILSAKERRDVEEAFCPATEPCLMTLGYEGLTIDAYINKLIERNVALAVDVRRNPISMKYGFSKTRFRNYLKLVGIEYEHMPALGIDSSLRKNLETSSDYRKLFHHYAKKSLPTCAGELQRIRELLRTHGRIALTCFEATPTSCHRHKITERLQKSAGWKTPIMHIE